MLRYHTYTAFYPYANPRLVLSWLSVPTNQRHVPQPVGLEQSHVNASERTTPSA